MGSEFPHHGIEPGIEPMPPSMEAQSLKYWTNRKVLEYSILKGAPLMICSRIEDYPVIIYILTVFMLPCCYNRLPKTPTFYEGTKRDIYTPTYQTGIMYNSVFLSIWIFLSPSSTCNFVHTRPSVSVMNGRCSQAPSCFVYTVNISKHLGRQLKHALFHLLLVAMQAQPLSILKQSSAVAFSLFSLQCA